MISALKRSQKSVLSLVIVKEHRVSIRRGNAALEEEIGNLGWVQLPQQPI